MVIFLKSKNTAPFRVLSWPSSLKHPTYVPRGREHSRDSEVPERGTGPNRGPTPRQRQGNPQPFLAKGTSQRSPGDEAAGQPFQSLPRHLHLVLSLSLFLVKAQTSCQEFGISLDTTFFHRPQLSKSGWFNYLPWTLFLPIFLGSERQVLSSPCDPEGRN